VTADPRLDTARTQTARRPWPTPTTPSVPRSGARWAGANPEPIPRTDAPPTANPTPGGR
jgi:hypothetical protein